jgi:hypothetical protein
MPHNSDDDNPLDCSQPDSISDNRLHHFGRVLHGLGPNGIAEVLRDVLNHLEAPYFVIEEYVSGRRIPREQNSPRCQPLYISWRNSRKPTPIRARIYE